MVNSTKHLRRINTDTIKPFQKLQEIIFPNTFYKNSITLTPKLDKDTKRKKKKPKTTMIGQYSLQIYMQKPSQNISKPNIIAHKKDCVP